MNSDGIVYDLNEIGQVIPKPFIKLVLGKVNVSEPPDESGYRNLPVVHNRKDWLWRVFIKLIMPFQMKTNKAGKRKTPFYGFIYMFLSWMILYFFH